MTLSKKLPFENSHMSNRDTHFQVSSTGPNSIIIREQFKNNPFDYKVNFLTVFNDSFNDSRKNIGQQIAPQKRHVRLIFR